MSLCPVGIVYPGTERDTDDAQGVMKGCGCAHHLAFSLSFSNVVCAAKGLGWRAGASGWMADSNNGDEGIRPLMWSPTSLT